MGFRIKDAKYDPKTDIFIIKEVELHEISVVSVPANPEALFSVSKGFDNEDEYNAFKSKFVAKPAEKEKEEEIKMTPEELKAALKEQEDRMNKAFDEKLGTVTATITAKDGSEKLMEDLEKRIKEAENKAENADNEAEKLKTESEKALNDFKAELKEKNDELKALAEKKAIWERNNTGDNKISDSDIDKAVIISKALGVDIDQTKFYKEPSRKEPWCSVPSPRYNGC